MEITKSNLAKSNDRSIHFLNEITLTLGYVFNVMGDCNDAFNAVIRAILHLKGRWRRLRGVVLGLVLGILCHLNRFDCRQNFVASLFLPAFCYLLSPTIAPGADCDQDREKYEEEQNAKDDDISRGKIDPIAALVYVVEEVAVIIGIPLDSVARHVQLVDQPDGFVKHFHLWNLDRGHLHRMTAAEELIVLGRLPEKYYDRDREFEKRSQF